MAAPKGNRFWEARSTHGRKPIFANPDELWNASVEYFKWVDDNPLMESRVAQDNGSPTIIEIPKMRAMTIGGLCLFLDITHVCWRDYCQQDDFSKVAKAIEEVIRDQKFTGAAGGFLNANIIARDLGLKESTSNEHTGANGGAIKNEVKQITHDMSAEDATRLYQDMLSNEESDD
jgi:hypothetical protein